MAASMYDPAGFAATLQGQIDLIKSQIPKPSMTPPPAVADNSNAGTDNTKYSIEGHTHASRARKKRVIGVNTAVYTWTYPTPFDAGVIPICNAIVEDPSNVATDSYNAQVVGTPTNTSCQFRIIRTSSGLIGLAVGALSLNPTPGNINLHCIALEP